MSLTTERYKQWAESYFKNRPKGIAEQLVNVNELKYMHEQLGTKKFLKHMSKVAYLTDQTGMDYVTQIFEKEGKI
jgi:hypothetical protein